MLKKGYSSHECFFRQAFPSSAQQGAVVHGISGINMTIV